MKTFFFFLSPIRVVRRSQVVVCRPFAPCAQPRAIATTHILQQIERLKSECWLGGRGRVTERRCASSGWKDRKRIPRDFVYSVRMRRALPAFARWLQSSSAGRGLPCTPTPLLPHREVLVRVVDRRMKLLLRLQGGWPRAFSSSEYIWF